MPIPVNINIAKMNHEKAIVYSGIEFIGRFEHYPIFSKTFFFAESPCQSQIAICLTVEDAINFLLSIREVNDDK
jgi:hypothetical protein